MTLMTTIRTAPKTPLVIVFSMIIAGTAFARSYSTTFRLDEDPISEGGQWLNGKTVGLDWSDVATVQGHAYGLQTGTGGYDDATALLSGTWGPDQSVTATVFSLHQTGGDVYEEVEIRLRSSLSPNWNEGYEINFRCLEGSSAYVQIVRWNGPVGSFTYLVDQKGIGVKDGDVVQAAIRGDLITVWINGVKAAQANDGAFRDGSPGMGFFLQGATGVNRDYGVSKITASDEIGR
jgi:hypothetical protein